MVHFYLLRVQVSGVYFIYVYVLLTGRERISIRETFGLLQGGFLKHV